MWVRGLKHRELVLKNQNPVAPYVGAWIETIKNKVLPILVQVAPYVGAWIETANRTNILINREVAPYVGAWIETDLCCMTAMTKYRRTLCGCVD